MVMLMDYANCLRCGHRWVRRQEREPVQCPECRSPFWNRKRARGQVEVTVAVPVSVRAASRPVPVARAEAEVEEREAEAEIVNRCAECGVRSGLRHQKFCTRKGTYRG